MLASFQHLGQNSGIVYISNAGRGRSEVHQTMEGVPTVRPAPQEAVAETSMVECSHVMVGDKGDQTMECPVCLVDKGRECFREISTCHHRCCSECLREYFRIEIMESRLAIACPECSELFHPNDIHAIVQDSVLIQKYEDFMVRRVLAMDSDTRWCPAPDCGYAVIATGCAGCPKLKCEREGCGTYFCYHCKQYWHPNQTCDAARAERSPNIRSASVSYSQESGAQNEIKSCPRCGAYIVKMDDGSCNHMTCAVCGAGFCWLCMKEISDLHYLSPSGCTFWGRKPWSRKKKILWQLGTLVGAPVGITLVAGIAVPAMIIGIPVWVGRKIHYRFDGASKHRRNLAITGGVAASILAAPIIAGLAVGIGVPILLAYVYGVVPFSLCRSGGCGVTTTNTGGVRFEFDEHDENNTQGPYSSAGDNHSIEAVQNVANPSIAPSIGDASLGMTNSLSASGSHMDRAGVLRDDSDRDSSSHRAIAGNSINGSLCSATYSSQHHKLEVQADISEHAVHCERSSVGGESYSLSLNDDASTKALAGSIISHKDKDGSSLCSRHFDGIAGSHVYQEEMGEKEDEECVSSSSGGGQQQMGVSSCPTSPHLRKASPAPSEDARSTRGKKCTRFKDQVSEIESRIDCLSIESIASNSSVLPEGDGVSATLACAALPLTPAAQSATKTALASCESLMSEGKTDSVGSMVMGKGFSFSSGGRMKAESTSVLMDGAESRRDEMGGSWKRSGCTSRDDLNQVERATLSRRKGSGVCDREHRSQPGNLSDISEMKGMPALHAAGCSDLLAVIGTSCENVFMERAGQNKARLVSASSSSSSSSDPVEFMMTKSFSMADRAVLEPCVASECGSCRYNGPAGDSAHSLSNVSVWERNNSGAEPFCVHDVTGSQTSQPNGENLPVTSTASQKMKHAAFIEHVLKMSPAQDTGKRDCDFHTNVYPVSLCKKDSCISGINSGSDSVTAVSPLPDVEMPVSPTETSVLSSPKLVEYKANTCLLSSQSSSVSGCKVTAPSIKSSECSVPQETYSYSHLSKKYAPVLAYPSSACPQAITSSELEGKVPSYIHLSEKSSQHRPSLVPYSESKLYKATLPVSQKGANSEVSYTGLSKPS